MTVQPLLPTPEARELIDLVRDLSDELTTDAVQVLGGYGYTRDFPVERFMREAKVFALFEGTSQIQRLVINRPLAKESR